MDLKLIIVVCIYNAILLCYFFWCHARKSSSKASDEFEMLEKVNFAFTDDFLSFYPYLTFVKIEDKRMRASIVEMIKDRLQNSCAKEIDVESRYEFLMHTMLYIKGDKCFASTVEPICLACRKSKQLTALLQDIEETSKKIAEMSARKSEQTFSSPFTQACEDTINLEVNTLIDRYKTVCTYLADSSHETWIFKRKEEMECASSVNVKKIGL